MADTGQMSNSVAGLKNMVKMMRAEISNRIETLPRPVILPKISDTSALPLQGMLGNFFSQPT